MNAGRHLSQRIRLPWTSLVGCTVGYDPFDGLAGHLRDEVEVPVVV